MGIAMSLVLSQTGVWEDGLLRRDLKREKIGWTPVEYTAVGLTWGGENRLVNHSCHDSCDLKDNADG
jgi:hypothetical protein